MPDDKLISASRLERKLRAILGLKGSNPIPDFESIRAFVQLEVDRPEWGFAGGERLWGMSLLQGAVALQFSRIGVKNPDNSGILGVVTLGKVQAATGLYFVGLLQNPVPGEVAEVSVPSFRRDGRYAATDRGTLVGSLSASAVQQFSSNSAAWEFERTSVQMTPEPVVFIVPPGQTLVVENSVVNAIAQGDFAGYEVPLERGLRG